MAYFEGATPRATEAILNWRRWCHRGASVVPINFHAMNDRGEVGKPVNEPLALAVEGLYRMMLKSEPMRARCVAFAVFGGHQHRIRAEFVNDFLAATAPEKMSRSEWVAFEDKERERASKHRAKTKLQVREWLQSFYGEVDRLPVGGAELPKIPHAEPYKISGEFARAQKREVAPKSTGWQ
jgi:predicted RNA-binding protein YlxR (DUF448 family)